MSDELPHIVAGEPGEAGPRRPAPSALPVLVPLAIGELADKITILEIKAARLTDAAKLANVQGELDQLRGVWHRQGERLKSAAGLKRALKEINEQLWVIEDAIRDCERRQDFGPKFIELARAVYRTNDRRAEIKREINLLAGSAIIEEKSYPDYRNRAADDPGGRPAAAGRGAQIG